MLRFLNAKVDLWFVMVLLFLGVIGTLVYGFGVRKATEDGRGQSAARDLLLDLAELPEPAWLMIRAGLGGRDVFQPQRLRFDDFSGLEAVDKDFVDDGVLLVSAYSDIHEMATVYLFDLQEQKVLHEWVPPADFILLSLDNPHPSNSKNNYKSLHPLLLPDGDLVIGASEGPLSRINACGELVWTVEGNFHHALEMDADGNFFVPWVLTPDWPSLLTMKYPANTSIRNDAIAKVSPNGKILETWSVAEILERNGYEALLYGLHRYNNDAIHLNDAQPILVTDEFVQKDDVVLSSRTLSTVFLYRPSTDKIIWLKVGPWLRQHDVDYHGDGMFTIFGNDTFDVGNDLYSSYGYSTIYQYDMAEDKIKPYVELKNPALFTATQGLHRVLENGDVFVEETDRGVLHRVSPEGLRWSYVSSIADGWIGAPHWSRYLTRDEAKFPWLENLDCGETHGG